MKSLSFFALLIGALVIRHVSTTDDLGLPENRPDVLYPKDRIWTTPSAGEEPRFNPPSLEWPIEKKGSYHVRLSGARDFSENLIEQKDLPFAIFNPHQVLDNGKWYWQVKTARGDWGPIDSFLIRPSTRRFETPGVEELIANIPAEHPRVLVHKAGWAAFRKKAASYRETQNIIEKANGFLGQAPPDEREGLPDYEGETKHQNDKIALLASRSIGDKVANVLNSCVQAYLLTGDPKYFETARKWMLEIAGWDPEGVTHLNNFGDSNIMVAMALGVDAFWDLLTDEEREQFVGQAAARARQFYQLWANNTETRSSSMHVWQHILHRMIQTSVALMGEAPEAEDWMAYLYELWIAQNPKMGETDGAWFNGTGYVRMNTLTLLDVPAIFQEYTGVDFIWSEWYANYPIWMNYAFPPASASDGFCNDGNRSSTPTLEYAGFSDAFARVTGNPYAAWYADKCLETLGKELSDDESFQWFRIQRGYEMKRPEPLEKFDLPQAAVFPDVGVAYLNTDLEHAENNLMLSIRSSPYGSLAHTHADQNTFNMAYGGKRLFYNTGYRAAMGDPHFLAWYKHTQGHNGILIDGQGQPFNAGAYGLIPRFLHGRQISYALGDASQAYTGKDKGENIDYGLKKFKRHYLLLRPSIVVIYDELEADHEAEWSWLIHHDHGLQVDAKNKTVTGENEAAGGQVSLFASSPVSFQLTDQFSVEPDNFTNKVNEDGDLMDFVDQWHFKAVTKEKTANMRYLAIIQVRPDKRYEIVAWEQAAGAYRVGDWKIRAEMDAKKDAVLEVSKADGSAAFVSNGALYTPGGSYPGTTTESSKLMESIEGRRHFQEAIDVWPASLVRVRNRSKQ